MSNYSKKLIQQVWEKGIIIQGYDPEMYRKDVCNAWICYTEFGKNTEYGWSIDHVLPLNKGGKNDIINLRPLQWQNNQSKGDDYPTYKAIITSEGNKNIEKEQNFTVNEDLQKQIKKLYNL